MPGRRMILGIEKLFDSLRAVAGTICNKKSNKAELACVYVLLLLGSVPAVAVALLMRGVKYLCRFIRDKHKYFKKKYRHGWAIVPAAGLVLAAILLIIVLGGGEHATAADLAAYKAATMRNKSDTLYGVDISNWQKSTYKDIIDDDDVDFVIMRATYGKDVDKTCDRAFQFAKSHEKLLGVYFFVNQTHRKQYDAREHARWAAEQVEGYIGWSIFVLDVENEGTTSNRISVEWATEWLKEFKKVTGVTPFIYMNADAEATNDWSEETISYPLWIANYNVRAGNLSTTHWDNWTIHQYTRTPIDKDFFDANTNSWWEYAKVK